MTSEFDPYKTWFGIQPESQPPDHYRLLGLRRFEADAVKIQVAVDKRVAFLQDVSGGDRVAQAQQLLNEVARARVCLADAAKKSDYDQTLRQQIQIDSSNESGSLRRDETELAAVPTWLFGLIGVLILLIGGGGVYLYVKSLPDNPPIADLNASTPVSSADQLPTVEPEEQPVIETVEPDETDKSDPDLEDAVEDEVLDDATPNSSQPESVPEQVDPVRLEPVTEDFESGYFTIGLSGPVDSPIGVWHPGTGVRINAVLDPGQRHLHILGGRGNSIQLKLAANIGLPATLEMKCEKWTVRDSNEDFFVLEISADGLDWNEVAVAPDSDPFTTRGNDGAVPRLVRYPLNEVTTKWIRLTCNGGEQSDGNGGILIGEVTISSDSQ